MLKTRVIPTLLWKNVGLVKGVAFNSWRRIGSIIPAVKVYNMRQVDEMIVLDISATTENRRPDLQMVAEISTECFCPLTIGGGIKNIENIENLLRAGADKVAINSSLYDNPELVKEAARRFGSQCIVISVDVKKNSRYCCYSHSGRVKRNIDVNLWLKQMECFGAGEILITSIDRDGTMKGYDLDLIRETSSNISVPVIASGGAGNYDHLYQAIKIGKASAVAAASMYHFTEQTPLEAKKYLASKGIPVRK